MISRGPSRSDLIALGHGSGQGRHWGPLYLSTLASPAHESSVKGHGGPYLWFAIFNSDQELVCLSGLLGPVTPLLASLAPVPLSGIYETLWLPGLFPLGKAQMDGAGPSPQEAHLLEGVVGQRGPLPFPETS